MKKPVIAAINGPAVGGGITIAMRWDIRVAAESARIGFVFVRRGAIPELLATWLLPRIIGVGKAAELLLSGRILTAREALEFGIVTHVWPDAEFQDRVREFALDMAQNAAPLSVAVTKQLIYGQLCETSPDKAHAIESEAFWWVGEQADAAEGARSFMEKRPPDWKLKPSLDFPKFLKPVE
jgi:enoyl-CoA hydratase/carnithine racemase